MPTMNKQFTKLFARLLSTGAQLPLSPTGHHAGRRSGGAGQGGRWRRDLPAVKVQYAKVTRTCKACHDDYRAKN